MSLNAFIQRFKRQTPTTYSALPDESTYSDETQSNDEREKFLAGATTPLELDKRRPRLWHAIHIGVLYVAIAILCLLQILGISLQVRPGTDLSIGIWSPVQDLVKYRRVEFEKHFDFDNRSPYTQKPSDELDEMWKQLYDFGLSGLSKEEADQLEEPTVHLPHDDSKYVVTLGVFHQLHCVNHLRRALYPDEYPGMWEYNADGTVKRDSLWALHWDHCLDDLRQALMCQADITPMPFFYRQSDDNIYSVLESTHYCRNFEDIRDWAKERQITHWVWNQTDTTDVHRR